MLLHPLRWRCRRRSQSLAAGVARVDRMRVPHYLGYAIIAFVLPIGLFVTALLLHRRIQRERRKALEASSVHVPGLDPPLGSRNPSLLWPTVLSKPSITNGGCKSTVAARSATNLISADGANGLGACLVEDDTISRRPSMQLQPSASGSSRSSGTLQPEINRSGSLRNARGPIGAAGDRTSGGSSGSSQGPGATAVSAAGVRHSKQHLPGAVTPGATAAARNAADLDAASTAVCGRDQASAATTELRSLEQRIPSSSCTPLGACTGRAFIDSAGGGARSTQRDDRTDDVEQQLHDVDVAL